MSDIESDIESMPALIKCDNGVGTLDQMRLQRPSKPVSTKIDKYYQTLGRQALSNTRPWRFSTVASHQ